MSTTAEAQAIKSVEDTLNDFFHTEYQRLFREPRYRYFQHKQVMYCWTTEPLDGTYAAFIYRPEGTGARTGKASQWRKVKELRFRQRKTAKARALKWYQTAKAGAA